MQAHPAPPARPIRVLCVDDLPDVTAVIRLLIEMEPDMECVGCLVSANELVEKVHDLKADVVLLDSTIPGAGKTPFEVMSELSRESPHVKIIIHSGHDDQAFIDRAMDAGAWGFVGKGVQPDVIMRAVREVAAGNTFFPIPGAGHPNYPPQSHQPRKSRVVKKPA